MTWPRLLGHLVSRPGLWVMTGQAQQVQLCTVARATKRACTYDLPAVRATARTTWALRAQCARDVVSGCAHYAHNPVL